MEHKGICFASIAVLGVLGVGYVGWRYQLRQLPVAIESGDLESADLLADGLFDAGQLGREIRVLSALLIVCVAGMWLTSRARPQAVATQAVGFGSYL